MKNGDRQRKKKLFLKLKKGLETWIIKSVFFGLMELNFVCLSKYNFNILNGLVLEYIYGEWDTWEPTQPNIHMLCINFLSEQIN